MTNNSNIEYESELIEIIEKIIKENNKKDLTKNNRYDIIRRSEDMKIDEIKVKVSVKWSLWDIFKLKILGIWPEKGLFVVGE